MNQSNGRFKTLHTTLPIIPLASRLDTTKGFLRRFSGLLAQVAIGSAVFADWLLLRGHRSQCQQVLSFATCSYLITLDRVLRPRADLRAAVGPAGCCWFWKKSEWEPLITEPPPAVGGGVRELSGRILPLSHKRASCQGAVAFTREVNNSDARCHSALGVPLRRPPL